jgi:FAD/FMN-containing dehydrogenase
MGTSTTTLDLAALRASVRGSVVGPDDAGYDAARDTPFGAADARPLAVVAPAGADDVASVVRLAAEHGLELAVRGGGHSAAGHATVDGGVVLDMRSLDGIDIDVADRSVWAGAGLTAVALSNATAEHGLAIGFGDTGSVGIGGITLGGGVGYLVRKHGLTVDNLLAAEVVTAAGDVVVADERSHAELFWALRGGGGNFGVVTRFRYRLHELGTIYGGMLVLPATAETVTGFLAAADAAPEELSTISNVMGCPPMPFIGAEHHGTPVVLALVCWAGDPAEAAAAVAPLRALAEPLADLLRPSPYPEMFPPDDPDYRPTVVLRTMFASDVDATTAATVVERIASSDAPMRAVQIRVLGGASARVSPDATAYAHRASRLMVNVVCMYVGEDDRPGRQAWVDDVSALLHDGDDAAYVNFVGDEGAERVRAAYPGSTWDRLRAVKARYDPANVFRRNHNIPPAGATLPAARRA